jgi:hypothetical protein
LDVFVLLLLGSSLLLPSLVFVLFFGLGKKDVLSGSRAIQVYRLPPLPPTSQKVGWG